MHEQVGDFLELAAVGDLQNVIAPIVQIVAGAADRAQGCIARKDARERDGFLGFEAGRRGAQFDSPQTLK
jgi:hypothetical protein